MRFNTHYAQEGKHAYLGASKYHWLGYTAEKFDRVFAASYAAKQGTLLHDLASQAIKLGVKLPRTTKTLNQYVNDAIGFRMTPEVTLLYSDNAFGTADALSFRDGLLRIHDLKTGVTPASMKQLLIYAALFCLEYSVTPTSIRMELRIYQNDEVTSYVPEADDVLHVMDRIITCDRRIEELKEELL